MNFDKVNEKKLFCFYFKSCTFLLEQFTDFHNDKNSHENLCWRRKRTTAIRRQVSNGQVGDLALLGIRIVEVDCFADVGPGFAWKLQLDYSAVVVTGNYVNTLSHDYSKLIDDASEHA